MEESHNSVNLHSPNKGVAYFMRDYVNCLVMQVSSRAQTQNQPTYAKHQHSQFYIPLCPVNTAVVKLAPWLMWSVRASNLPVCGLPSPGWQHSTV